MPLRVFAVVALASVVGCTQGPVPQGTSGVPARGEPAPDPVDPPSAERSADPAAPGTAVSPVIRLERIPSAEARAGAMVEFRQALALQRAERHADAARTFAAAGESVPALRDWGFLLAADAAARAGDTAQVRRHLEAGEAVRVREWGWRFREQGLRTARDTLGALRFLETVSGRIADPTRRADALRTVGELREWRGDAAGAIAAYREAMEAAPASRAARDAATAFARLAVTPADRLIEGRVWLRHGNADRGVAAMNAFLGSGAGSPAVRAEAQLLAGRSLFNARRYAEAERFLLGAAQASGASASVASEALFIAGRAQFRDGRGSAARSTWLSVADRYPTEVAAAQALFVLGDLDQGDGRMDSARTHFRRAASLRVDATEAALSAVRLGIVLLLDGEAREAARVLDDFARDRPNHRLVAQARYWAARAHLAAGDRATANERFAQARRADPVSYYGSLATQRLGGTLADLDLAPEPTADARTRHAVDVALFRVDFLRELGLADFSAFEMERARVEVESTPAALYLIAEAHIERGAPVAGILLGREIQRREDAWNPRLLRIVYPFPHRALIEAEARRNRLDPFMVAGLIRQESMFNPIAVSPAGAIGLMQVMPTTGRMLAQRAGVSGFDPAMLRQPELNVRLGTLFLADLLSRNSNRTEAFAAYNAGPGRMAQWRALREIRDEEMFAERIPFTETRDYVKILNFNAQMYRLLYGE